MVVPYCKYSSLKDYFTRTNNMNNEHEKMRIFQGIARGVQYMHRNNIAHFDLKSDNVFVSSDGTPLLSDFGNSYFLYNIVTNIGTPTTRSPEVCAGAILDEKVDMFALGRIYEQLQSNFEFEFMIPQTEFLSLTDAVVSVNDEFLKLDFKRDRASDEYVSNFRFIYSKREFICENEMHCDFKYNTFVSKYEEECNKYLPRTSIKYLSYLKNPDFDFKKFFAEKETDPLYKGLLTIKPEQRWSADLVLKYLEITDNNSIGENLEDTLYVPKLNDYNYRNFDIHLSKKSFTFWSLDFFVTINIFTNILDRESLYSKVLIKDNKNIQERLQKVKEFFGFYKNVLKFNACPKYFDWKEFIELLKRKYSRVPFPEQVNWLIKEKVFKKEDLEQEDTAESSFLERFFSFFI